jgi:hypothetical protein
VWRTFAEDRVTLSEGSKVATQTRGSHTLTTTGTELTEGKHYWEVELLSQNMDCIFIGISRPNLDPAGRYFDRGCTDGWFIFAYYGALYGNGNDNAAIPWGHRA